MRESFNNLHSCTRAVDDESQRWWRRRADSKVDGQADVRTRKSRTARHCCSDDREPTYRLMCYLYLQALAFLPQLVFIHHAVWWACCEVGICVAERVSATWVESVLLSYLTPWQCRCHNPKPFCQRTILAQSWAESLQKRALWLFTDTMHSVCMCYVCHWQFFMFS